MSVAATSEAHQEIIADGDLSLAEIIALSDKTAMELVISDEALDDLKAMPKRDAATMLKALQQVAEMHPQRLGFVTEMVGVPGCWRVRKGDWRALYRTEEHTMIVVWIRKRSEAYR
jgi:mRNA interferase RelE/StbE